MDTDGDGDCCVMGFVVVKREDVKRERKGDLPQRTPRARRDLVFSLWALRSLAERVVRFIVCRRGCGKWRCVIGISFWSRIGLTIEEFMTVQTLKLGSKRFVVVPEKDFRDLERRAKGAGQKGGLEGKRGGRDRADVQLARKRLGDPNEKPIAYEQARKELGLR